MIPTNVRNIHLSKKSKQRKAKKKLLAATEKSLYISKRKSQKQKDREYYLEVVAEQKFQELFWRQQRKLLGLTWACGFDKDRNTVAVRRS